MTRSDVGALVAVSSLFGGLLTFVLSEFRKYFQEDAAEISRWQSVVVYTVVRDAGSGGISFKKLYDEYINKARNWERKEVAKGQLTESELSRVLVGLKAQRAITELVPGTYSSEGISSQLSEMVLLAQENMRGPEDGSIINYAIKNKIESCAIKSVASTPFSYNFEDLCVIVATNTKQQQAIVKFVLAASYDIGRLKVDEKNRLGIEVPKFARLESK